MKYLPWFSCFLLGGTLCLAGTDSMAACTNTIVSETFSPNGRLKAVVFMRECGAGVRNAHLSVLPASGVLPAGFGNTFIGEGGLSADDKQRPRVDITWLSDSELSVLHGVVRRVRHEGRVQGVKVYYGHLVDLPPKNWLK